MAQGSLDFHGLKVHRIEKRRTGHDIGPSTNSVVSPITMYYVFSPTCFLGKITYLEKTIMFQDVSSGFETIT